MTAKEREAWEAMREALRIVRESIACADCCYCPEPQIGHAAKCELGRAATATIAALALADKVSR